MTRPTRTPWCVGAFLSSVAVMICCAKTGHGAAREADVLGDALALRFEAAEDFFATLETAVLDVVPAGTARRPFDVRSRRVEPGDMPLRTGQEPLELQLCRSSMVVQRPDDLDFQSWTSTAAGVDRWDHVLNFLHQDSVARHATSLRLQGPEAGAHLAAAPPRDDDRWWLVELGLALKDGSSLLGMLSPPYNVEHGKTLRESNCVVVTTVDGELWLAADLDFAPLRLVRRGDQTGWGYLCNDWWGYRPVGSLQLPTFHCQRGFSVDGLIEDLLLTRIATAAVGAANVEALAPPPLRVPIIPGTLIKRRDAAPGAEAKAVSLPPVAVWRAAEDDCRTWGVSIQALANDPELRAPGPAP